MNICILGANHSLSSKYKLFNFKHKMVILKKVMKNWIMNVLGARTLNKIISGLQGERNVPI